MKRISATFSLLFMFFGLLPAGAYAASSPETQVRQQFAERAGQSMSIEYQGEMLSEEMQRIRTQLAAASKAASEDKAMCGEMNCEGAEVAATALAKYLQALQAVLSSTEALRKQMHRMAGIMVDTEGLLLESKGGLNDQEMAVAVSDALIDFNQIITGNIGTLSKRLNLALGDFTVSAANTAGRTGNSMMLDSSKATLRKLVATALSQSLQEDINTIFSKGVKDPNLVSSTTNEVLNQAIDALTAQAYNAYLANPSGKIELSPSTIGLGVLRAGLEGIAKEKLKQRQDRLSALKQQLSENERNRMLWILQWRLSQRLYIHLRKAEKQAGTLLEEFEGLAVTCRIKRQRLKECRAEAETDLKAVSDKYQARIEAASSKLKDVRKDYEARLKTLDELRAKIAANEKKAGEWNRKYAQARKDGSSAADSYRESRDMAERAVEDELLALRSHEAAIDSEFAWPLDQARLALEQAIEQGQMAMEFAQNDALRKVRACLEIAPAAAGKRAGGNSAAGQGEAVLDELLAYALKTQDDALAALKAVKITYSQDGCGKPKEKVTTGSSTESPAPTGTPIDPEHAGLYSFGGQLVRLTVEGSRIRGEVVDVCHALQGLDMDNFSIGDAFLEGTGSGDGIEGRLRMKKVSRLVTPPGMKPLECKWEQPMDQWVQASFHFANNNLFGKYTIPLSMIECGTAARPINGEVLHWLKGASPWFSSAEKNFQRGCDEFIANNPNFNPEMEAGMAPEMPVQPLIEEPLLQPEPPGMLLPEPPR